MPTWLVTGGAGFIGGNFVLDAVARGVRVINLDALTYAGNLDTLASLEGNAAHVFVHGDIGDRALVARLLAEHRTGCGRQFRRRKPCRSFDRRPGGVRADQRRRHAGPARSRARLLARAATKRKRDAFRFLHVSTDEVYGSLGETGKFTELTPFAPNSPYSASKAASDHLVRAFHHTYGLPVLTTNCSNNYGPFQFPEKLIPLVIAKALAGEPLPIYGDGRYVRDWLHVSDHCAAIHARARARPRRARPTTSAAMPSARTSSSCKTICALLDARKPLPDGRARESLMTFVKDRPGHDRRYAIDSSKLQRELGWKPAADVRAGHRTDRGLVPRAPALGAARARRQLSARTHRRGGLITRTAFAADRRGSTRCSRIFSAAHFRVDPRLFFCVKDLK